MKKLATLTAAAAFALGFAFSVVGVGSAGAAEFQAYSISGATITGNQAFTGGLGNDFDVISPITINSLGVYDEDADGISGSIDVHIFDLSDTSTPLASETITGSGDPLMGQFRFKDITPLILAPGSYSVVAFGFDSTDQNGNENLSSGIPLVTDDGGGLISFIRSRFGAGDPTVTFPTSLTTVGCSGQPEACFAAGSFKYEEEGITDPLGDTDNPEIDISSVEVSDDGTTLSCMLFVDMTDDGVTDGLSLLPKSTFRCHIDFDDDETVADIGCDPGADPFSIGESNNGVCTTSDITLTYRVGRRGGKCTGTGVDRATGCTEKEFDVEGNFDNVCNGDVSGGAEETNDAVSCKITIDASLADITAVRDAECDTDECLTNKDGNGDYDVFMFFDSQLRGDRDRVPDTNDNNKPNDPSETVTIGLTDPALP